MWPTLLKMICLGCCKQFYRRWQLCADEYSSTRDGSSALIWPTVAVPPCSTDVLYDKYTNYMTMTTSGQIMPWPDYLKRKGNVNIKLWDFCEILIVYILLSTFQSVHIVLTVNKPDVRWFIAWIESADWNLCMRHQCKWNMDIRCCKC